MEFYDVVRCRRSIRAYEPEPLAEDALTRIIEAVNLAPTACNLQPFRFLLVAAPQTRAAIAACYPQPWLAQAPMIVVALGNADAAWKRLNGSSSHTLDVAIAMEHLVLAAAAEGLGTCWVCAFDQERMRRALGLEPQWEVVAITPLGKPAETPGKQQRKPIAEIVERID
jgi:nitroreductase